jgi:single-strand selective monofunctional uracil DNA glycosylase
VSGRRLWGWARERYRNPERFFRDFFVLNYCPLIFFDSEGRNLTPDKLPAHQRARLFALCDGALAQAVACLKVDWAIGVGRFAEQRARVALSEQDVTIGRITHPSPANPKANRGWSTVIQTELGSIGVKVR